MILQFDPFDTLFFRDGKPFTMGDESTAAGIFPPYPSTVFGAIRGAVLAQNTGLDGFIHGQIQAEIGTPVSYDRASIWLKGIFLSHVSSELYFPAPLDLVTDSKKEKARSTRLVNTPPFESNQENYNDYIFSVGLDKTKRANGYYLNGYGLRTYLTGSASEFDLFSMEDFCETEYKTGIKKNSHTGTTEEGHLYRAGMRRLKEDYRLVCDIEGIPSLTEKGVLKLGGEGKVVRYESVPFSFPNYRDAVIERMEQSGRLKLYFVTPAIFEGQADGTDAWKPDENFLSVPNGKLRLLTAATGQPLSIGGWALLKGGKRGGHKPMRKAVPAGSVYYYQIESGDPAAIFDKLNYHNLSLNAREGFGLALVGGV